MPQFSRANPPNLHIIGYQVTDPALTDPCEDHTVLNDTWRSTDCKENECSDNGMCEKQLGEGWYRFKRITSHPGTGEGSGTVCFNWKGKHCSWKREIKIKNCDGYFVYELKPTPGCDAAYCTDPGTAPTLGADDKSQPESTESGSPIPTESPTSDSESQTINVEISSMRELDDDTAKKVALRRVQQMFQDQCPKQPIDWDEVEVQCWDVDEPDP
ncbi:uncharacterized protein LOC144511497 [Mustelus asterias]